MYIKRRHWHCSTSTSIKERAWRNAMSQTKKPRVRQGYIKPNFKKIKELYKIYPEARKSLTYISLSEV